MKDKTDNDVARAATERASIRHANLHAALNLAIAELDDIAESGEAWDADDLRQMAREALDSINTILVTSV